MCVLLLAPAFTWAAPAGGAAREGTVQFSNDQTLAGRLSLGPGDQLKISVGNELRVLPFGQIQEIFFTPEKEEMTQKWRFLEAGQTAKQAEGKPYPLRTLRATVKLANGQQLTGHLYTTVLYLETDDTTQKVILSAKQRGQEGETLASLVYPRRIVFASAAPSSAETMRIRIALPELGAVSEVVALTHGGLDRLEGDQPDAAGEHRLPSPLGQRFFLAARTGRGLVVGWPKEPDPSLRNLVQKALPLADDFFDQRQLLGVFHDQEHQHLYSLLLLSRKGETTLAETRSQPWRLAVFRWNYDPQTQRLLLAGQNYFFRGILARGESPPVVQLSPELWNLKQTGGVWMAVRP